MQVIIIEHGSPAWNAMLEAFKDSRSPQDVRLRQREDTTEVEVKIGTGLWSPPLKPRRSRG